MPALAAECRGTNVICPCRGGVRQAAARAAASGWASPSAAGATASAPGGGVATTPRAVTHKHRHTPPEWPNPNTSGASASLLAGAGRFLVGKDRPPNDIRQAHCRCTVLSSPCRFTLQMQGTRQDERTQNSATEECDRSNRLLVRITGSPPQPLIRITVVLCFVCSFPLEFERSFDTRQFSICNTDYQLGS